MKLNRLDSTTQHHSQTALERVHHAASDDVRRVEAMEGVDSDRQRSLQQELAEVDPRALGPFCGSAHVLQDAREVAAQLTLLGGNVQGLVQLQALSLRYPRIDDEA